MRRLARDAALVAATALAVWFARGDAQDTAPVGYGEPFQLVCLNGTIDNAAVFDGPPGKVDLRWTFIEGVNAAFSTTGANLTDCTAYPDLRASQ